MRFACDTGGTFTDLIVEDDDGVCRMFKASTTPSDPVKGVLDALQVAADAMGVDRTAMLEKGSLFIHGTTHAINAIITGRTARTALLTTQGHRDILILREGGRAEAFNFAVPFPDPYIPRALTFEVPGRIRFDGKEIAPFDEAEIIRQIGRLKAEDVEAVAVCLLWSVVNPAHEERVGELLEKHLPGVPYTLSHRLNPSLREFRRASSAAVDASLKPLMGHYMSSLQERLTDAGFAGRVLVITSNAGVIDARDAASAPIHIVNSGPSMAPVAGRWFAQADEGNDNAIVADTGGTTYDVSLIRRGLIPMTRETWIGEPHRGVMLGFPWVDVKSVGAGGGSIAWVDNGGLLHVGPQSAGAVPGPVAYGRGGTLPTVTDASVVLGHLDPEFFLGGTMSLDREGAEAAIREYVAEPLGMDVAAAADAILAVATENMVQAIVDITVNQGIDPREAVLIGGGGAAGLNSVRIAQRLGCSTLVIPSVGATLSAAGALMSDLKAEYHAACFASTARFDRDKVNETLASLRGRCEEFAASSRAISPPAIRYKAEARYDTQVWEIEAPVRGESFESDADVDAFVADFHAAHKDLFGFDDPASAIEVVGWTATVTCALRDADGLKLSEVGAQKHDRTRKAYFSATGWTDVPVCRFDAMEPGEGVTGPALLENALTTVVIDPGAVATRRASGGLSIAIGGK
ncbi:hydantoinase/oxoprolinase family protein [Sphingobium sp.]|uniref:hydantoinase/oxoprolinase family protein n=1 Tax=Sphingobium sp. TaxID=1912891 RepID=UPI0028BE0641|nr:hydantoinase/oxoprolinase family protein [Sphingobium sp.]